VRAGPSFSLRLGDFAESPTVISLIDHHHWGFDATELIQHARVSPDGRWLTFYLRVFDATQGIHLLDLRTGRHSRSTDPALRQTAETIGGDLTGVGR